MMRYVERAIAAGADAADACVDVWEGMAHGVPSAVGTLAAYGRALEDIGVFLRERW